MRECRALSCPTAVAEQSCCEVSFGSHLSPRFTRTPTQYSRVTPSPESMTTPVSVRSVTLELDHDAASASTAWTAMYRPATLNDSNMISAVFSRFSGGLSGGSVWRVSELLQLGRGVSLEATHKENIVILGLGAEILEDALLPEPLHLVPVVDHAVADGVVEGVGPGVSGWGNKAAAGAVLDARCGRAGKKPHPPRSQPRCSHICHHIAQARIAQAGHDAVPKPTASSAHSLGVRDGLVTNEEVEVFDTALRSKMTRLGSHGRGGAPAARRARGRRRRILGRDHGREHERGLRVAGETGVSERRMGERWPGSLPKLAPQKDGRR